MSKYFTYFGLGFLNTTIFLMKLRTNNFVSYVGFRLSRINVKDLYFKRNHEGEELKMN